MAESSGERPTIPPGEKKHESRDDFEGRTSQSLNRSGALQNPIRLIKEDLSISDNSVSGELKMHKGRSGTLYETTADMLAAGDHPDLDETGRKREINPWPPKQTSTKIKTEPELSKPEPNNPRKE